MSPRDLFGFLFLIASIFVAYMLVRTEQAETRASAGNPQSTASNSSIVSDFTTPESLPTEADDPSSSSSPTQSGTTEDLPDPAEGDETRLESLLQSRPALTSEVTTRPLPAEPICNYTLEIRNMLRSIRSPDAGDLNNDGIVALEDLSILLESFGEAGDMHYADGDIDSDGDVDEDDLVILAENMGNCCP